MRNFSFGTYSSGKVLCCPHYWAIFPPVEVMVQQPGTGHGGHLPMGQETEGCPQRGHTPHLQTPGDTTQWVSWASRVTSGQQTNSPAQGSLECIYEEKGLYYQFPCPWRACPPSPPSLTCCWRTRCWRQSSCPSRSPPHSASLSHWGKPALPALAPVLAPRHSLLPRRQGLLQGWPHPCPAPPPPPPPVQAQDPQHSLLETTMEILITTGISWECQVRCESRHEVDSSLLFGVGRFLKMAPRIRIPWSFSQTLL